MSKDIKVSKNIRKASANDISRIAEILVFSKRKNYRHIFNNDIGSFVELQVYPLADEFSNKPELLNDIFVYDNEFVKGVMHVEGPEVKELYIEPFFEGNGIGGELIEFAKAELNCHELWVLNENKRAIEFYKRHGFCETNETRTVPEAPNLDVLEAKMIRTI